MRKILIGFFLLLSSWAFAQLDTLPYIDISKIALLDTLSSKLASTTAGRDFSMEKDFSSLSFKPGHDFQTGIRPEVVTKKIIIAFNLTNTSDTTKTIYFSPGFPYEKIELYEKKNGVPVRMPSRLPPVSDSIGYRMIEMSSHDSATIFAVLQSVKTYTTSFRPRLINAVYLPAYTNELHHYYHSLDQMTYIFAGLLLMMILFSLASYLTGANNEFLYYSLYALFLGVMLFSKSYFFQRASEWSYFIEAYLDFILQSVGIIFYMLFMQRFLNTRKKYPFLHHFYNAGIAMLLLSMLAYSYFHYFTVNYAAEYFVENIITKILLILMILIFVVYSFRKWEDKLLRFLVWGNISLFVFALYSQALILFNLKFDSLPYLLNNSLFYYELALFLELVFFLMGLTYKNRQQIVEQTREKERLKMENERKEFEKQMAVITAQQDERNRISADMHDELGSGMTAIRLMSEIAKNKMKENVPAEIERISQSANDVLNKMNAIIWSMNSSNDSLGNLVSYIRAYALEYFESTPVQCKVNIPEKIADNEVTGEKRRNLFLCVKESLNNILKHSKATQLAIDIQADGELKIIIQDNGVGIDFQKIRQFGNGLQNIERRMKTIGGKFTIRNNNGVLTILEMPLS